MRRAARLDSNHKEIVEAFLALGWSVKSTAGVGYDFPDLVVAKHGVNILVEVKDTKGKLSPGQSLFRQIWKGRTEVVRSVQDVEALKV